MKKITSFLCLLTAASLPLWAQAGAGTGRRLNLRRQWGSSTGGSAGTSPCGQFRARRQPRLPPAAARRRPQATFAKLCLHRGHYAGSPGLMPTGPSQPISPNNPTANGANGNPTSGQVSGTTQPGRRERYDGVSRPQVVATGTASAGTERARLEQSGNSGPRCAR